MKVTAEQLEARFEQLSDAELRAVATATGNEYTETAKSAARVMLERRAARQAAEPAVDLDLSMGSLAGDHAFLRLQKRIANVSSRPREWCEAQLPERVPSRIRELFWIGLTSGLPAFASVGIAFVSANNLAAAAYKLASFSSMAVLSVGLAGLVLSYGIARERLYPRFLSVAFVAGAAFCSLRRRNAIERAMP